MPETALSFVLHAWFWDPVILLGLGLLAASYGYGFYYFRRHGWLERVARRGLIRRSQPLFFAAGVLTLFIALVSPIHELSEQLLTGHMLQHILLMFVAPVLLLLGLPVPFARVAISQLRLRPILAWLVAPTMAYALYNANLLVWHIPVLYDAAVEHDLVHGLEHGLFFLTGLIAWWPVIDPAGGWFRASGPVRLLYLFLMMAPGTGLAAFLVYSTRVLYPVYLGSTAAWGVSPLTDQAIAGVAMWIPVSVAYVLAAAAVFFEWFRSEDAAEWSG